MMQCAVITGSLRHLLYSLTSVVVIDDVRDVCPGIEVPLVT